jgi:hypothetical protein
MYRYCLLVPKRQRSMRRDSPSSFDKLRMHGISSGATGTLVKSNIARQLRGAHQLEHRKLDSWVVRFLKRHFHSVTEFDIVDSVSHQAAFDDDTFV